MSRMVHLPGEWSSGHVCTQHPSLCCRRHQGATEPCEVAVAGVRAVLALIWKQMRQCYFEMASGQGKWEDAAMTPVPFPPGESRGLYLGFCSGASVMAICAVYGWGSRWHHPLGEALRCHCKGCKGVEPPFQFCSWLPPARRGPKHLCSPAIAFPTCVLAPCPTRIFFSWHRASGQAVAVAAYL